METNVATSIRQLFEPRSHVGNVDRSTRTAAEDESEYKVCSFGRIGTRQQASVTFLKADGSLRNYSYTHYVGIEAENPDCSFSVNFTGAKVTIRGRNLLEVIRLIGRHWPEEICEIGTAKALELGKEKSVIEEMEFKRG